jgi:hypothetical protein
MEHNFNIKEIHIIQYTFTFIIKKIQDVPIIPCLIMKGHVLKNNLIFLRINCQNKILTYFQIQIEPNSTPYICINFLHNISENKPPLY